MKEKSNRQYSKDEMRDIDATLDIVESKIEDFTNSASDLFVKFFGMRGLKIKMKSLNDFSTHADLLIEEMFQSWVAKNFQDHSVYGEEYGKTSEGQANWLWAIDPIDGTTNFKNGNPECAIVVSLRYKDSPMFTVVNFPIKNEEFRARMYRGVTLNGHSIELSSETNLRTSIISLNYLNHIERMVEFADKLWDEVGGIHMKMCSLSEVCDVISGRLQAAVLYELGPHEWPAAYLLAKESGARIEPLARPSLSFETEGLENKSFVLACNKEILNSVNRLMGNPKKLG